MIVNLLADFIGVFVIFALFFSFIRVQYTLLRFYDGNHWLALASKPFFIFSDWQLIVQIMVQINVQNNVQFMFRWAPKIRPIFVFRWIIYWPSECMWTLFSIRLLMFTWKFSDCDFDSKSRHLNNKYRVKKRFIFKKVTNREITVWTLGLWILIPYNIEWLWECSEFKVAKTI